MQILAYPATSPRKRHPALLMDNGGSESIFYEHLMFLKGIGPGLLVFVM